MFKESCDPKPPNIQFPEYGRNAIYTYNEDALLPGESYCSGCLSYKYVCHTLGSELYPVTHDTSQTSEQYHTSPDSHRKINKPRKQKSLTLKPTPNKNNQKTSTPRRKIEDSQIEPNISNNNPEDISVTTKETNTYDQIFKKPADIPKKKLKSKNHLRTPENNLRNHLQHGECETDRDEKEITHKQECVSMKEKQKRIKDVIVPYRPNDSKSTLGSELYPFTHNTSQKSKQNNTTTDTHQNVTKPRKRRKQFLTLRPTPNKKKQKTTIPRNEIEDKSLQSSCKTTKNVKKQKIQTQIDKEEHLLRTPPRPIMHKRRTLYSPSTFKDSADLTKVFSGYAELEELYTRTER